MADQRDLKLAIEIDANPVKAVQGLVGLKSAVSDNTQALEKADAEAKRLGGDFEASGRKTDSLGIQIALAKGELERLGHVVGKTHADYQTLDSQIKTMEVDLKRSAQATSTLEKAYGTAQTKADMLRNSLARKTAALRDSERALQQAGIDVKNLASEYDRLTKEAAQANDKLKDGSTQATASIGKLNTSIGQAVRTALGMAAATVGIYQVKNAFESILETGGKFESLGASLDTLMGSVAAGKAASAWISKFAMDTPLELDDVTKAFIKLKAFGLDPMDGTLRALTAQNAKMSGSAEDLQGIILALGQAWTKQKLQAEDANQLLERGVPIWDMLSKIMGKSSAEVMALSEAGKIGRKEIKALIDEMGRSSDGALEAQMKTWNGLVSNLKDNWTQFLNTIAQSGALDYFKDQIATVNAELQQMAADGTLQERAQRIADAMVSIARGLKSIVTGAYENRAALATLGETLAALKLAEAAGGLLAFANNMKTAGLASLGMVGTLGPAIAAVGALTFAEQRINAALEEHERRAKRVADAERDSTSAKDALIAKVRETIHATEQYADTAIESAEQVKAKNQEQAKAYAASLTEAQRYWNAMEIALRRAGDSDGAAKAQAKADAYGEALKAATAHVEALSKANAELAAPKFDNAKLDAFAAQVKAAATNTTEAKKAWDDYVKSLTGSDLAGIAEAGRQKLEAVKIVTGENSEESKRWAGVIDSALRESLTRMGIDANKALTGVSSEVRNGIGQFEDLRRVLDATGVDGRKAGGILLESFSNLIGKAKTREDLDSIKAKMDETWKSGRIGFTEMLGAYTQWEQASTKIKGSTAEVTAAQAKAAQSANVVAEAYKNGTLTADMLAKATQDAANAANLKASASDADAAATARASNASLAHASVLGEVARHDAAVAAQRRQNAAEQQAQAQARQQAASAEIHDGETVTQMWDQATAAALAYGDKGWSAMQTISRAIGGAGASWNLYFEIAGRWNEQAAKQAETVDRLTGNLQEATRTGYGLGDAIASASKHFDKMDENHLEKLNAALDAARAKVRDLEDAIAGRLNNLADELDRKLGNEQAIEQRRYQEQQKQIKQDLDVAKGLGSSDALAKAKEEQRIAKQIHNLNMKEAQAKQQEAQQQTKAQDAPGKTTAPPPHAGTVNFDALVNGQKIPLKADSAEQVHTLIKQIGRAGLRTVGR